MGVRGAGLLYVHSRHCGCNAYGVENLAMAGLFG